MAAPIPPRLHRITGSVSCLAVVWALFPAWLHRFPFLHRLVRVRFLVSMNSMNAMVMQGMGGRVSPYIVFCLHVSKQLEAIRFPLKLELKEWPMQNILLRH